MLSLNQFRFHCNRLSFCCMDSLFGSFNAFFPFAPALSVWPCSETAPVHRDCIVLWQYVTACVVERMAKRYRQKVRYSYFSYSRRVLYSLHILGLCPLLSLLLLILPITSFCFLPKLSHILWRQMRWQAFCPKKVPLRPHLCSLYICNKTRPFQTL